MKYSAKNISPEVVIDYRHHECHIGSMFRVGQFFMAQSATSTKYFYIATSDNEVHIDFGISMDSPALVTLYEGVTMIATSLGTEIPVSRMNRASSVEAQTKFYLSTTYQTIGTKVADTLLVGETGGGLGANQRSNFGGSILPGAEWILAANTSYLLTVNNSSNLAAITMVKVEFYEEE